VIDQLHQRLAAPVVLASIGERPTDEIVADALDVLVALASARENEVIVVELLGPGVRPTPEGSQGQPMG
jgi:hypothetical protein